MSATNAWNLSFFATKSVSLLTSTRAPLFPSAAMTAATRPSVAALPAFLAAAARPFLRRVSTAFSISPPVSSSAFLQSSMPAPVLLRSSLTCAAVIATLSSHVTAVSKLHLLIFFIRQTRPQLHPLHCLPRLQHLHCSSEAADPSYHGLL